MKKQKSTTKNTEKGNNMTNKIKSKKEIVPCLMRGRFKCCKRCPQNILSKPEIDHPCIKYIYNGKEEDYNY